MLMIITLMYLHKQLRDKKRSIYTEQLSAYDELILHKAHYNYYLGMESATMKGCRILM